MKYILNIQGIYDVLTFLVNNSNRPYHFTRDKQLNEAFQIIEDLWNSSDCTIDRTVTYTIQSTDSASGNLERLELTYDHFYITEDDDND